MFPLIKTGFSRRYIRKNGKTKSIVVYSDDKLRQRHKYLKYFIERNTIPSTFAKAYIKNRSVYGMVRAHLYNDFYIKTDIKSFFSNISHDILINTLYYEINKKNKVATLQDCSRIVSECTISSEGLPIGFVTSPVLSNLYLKSFDGKLYGYIKKLGFRNPIYTRYADDIVLSFKLSEEMTGFFYKDIIDRIEKYLGEYKLHLNHKKTKIIDFRISNHIKITGVNITVDSSNYRQISIGRKKIDDFYWQICNLNKQDIERKVKSLLGMYSYIISIEGENFENKLSTKMRDRYINLNCRNLKDYIHYQHRILTESES
jgi:hypothetical protein